MYCGIDIGTSSIKCLLVDEAGTRLGLGRAPVGLYREGSAYEADPLEWLKASALALAEARANAGLDDSGLRSRLRGLAVSGNGPTFVAVGADGLPVGRASSWMDRSAATEAATLSKLAGRRIDPSFYLPKALRALAADRKGLIKKLFSGPEYLAFTLGAGAVSYLANDYYDAFVWDLETARKYGFDASLFPPYVAPAERIGTVSAHAAEAIGLPTGIPIVSGFPDFLAALVGSGTVVPGLACDRSGSSEAINVCAGRASPNPAVFSLPHAIPGLWNLSGGLTTSGKALEWFSRVAGYSGLGSDSVYQDAGMLPADSDLPLFLPYLAGERAPLWNPDLRGAFVGLSLSHGRREMARAVVEAIAFGLRLAADTIKADGFTIDSVRCSGAAAHNDALCTIKAEVLGLPVEVPQTPECEAMGDACACAVALADHASLGEASRAMVHVESRFDPSRAGQAIYDERYTRWRAALDSAIELSAAP